MAVTRPRGRPKSFHDKTAENTIQSLDRALMILKVVADAGGLTLTELASRTDQAAPTVYRVLTTLQTHGFVEMEDPGQLWHVGGGAFRVGSQFLRRTKVVERARAPMDRLMRATGETANLGVEMRDQVLFLSQVETHETIRAFFPPGTLGPMHVSGIGKALLAWYPDDRVRQIAAAGLPGIPSGPRRSFSPTSPRRGRAAMRSTTRNGPRACAVSPRRSSTPTASRSPGCPSPAPRSG